MIRIIADNQSNLKKALRTIESIKPLKGVVNFLTYLKNNGEYLGVVTGNFEEPAKLILEKSNLMNFFSIFSYDNSKSERKQILERAINDAKNLKYNFSRVILVGDTTKDIEAGRCLGTFTVAVATGSDSLEKLSKANPDILLPSLTKYEHILEILK